MPADHIRDDGAAEAQAQADAERFLARLTQLQAEGKTLDEAIAIYQREQEAAQPPAEP